MVPKRTGSVRAFVDDLCIDGVRVTLDIKVADIGKIEIEGPELVRLSFFSFLLSCSLEIP